MKNSKMITASDKLELYESLFNNSIIGLYQTTPEGEILTVNPTLVKMLKYDSVEELLKVRLPEGSYVDARKRDLFKQLLEENDEITNFESEWYAKTGEIIYIREGARAIRNEHNIIVRYDGVVEDISEKKKTEFALIRAKEIAEESELKYKAIFDNANVGIAIGKDNLVIAANKVVENISGYNADEMINKPISDFYHPDDLHILTDRAIRRSNGEYMEPFFTMRVVRKNGDIKFVSISTSMFTLNNEQYVQAVFVDITESKKSERLLVESEERFRYMIKNIPAIIVTLDKNGTQKFVSPAAEKITGFTPEELSGRSLAEIIHPDDLHQALKKWTFGIANPLSTITFQYRHIHKTKEWVYLEAVGQNFLDEPAINEVVVIVQDITERKQAEKQIYDQLDELSRWQDVMLNREDRILELKSEVNELLALLGKEPRYSSTSSNSAK